MSIFLLQVQVPGCKVWSFDFFFKLGFNNWNGMASLGMLNLLWVELLVRLLIKERIDLLGMQSLKYEGPIPIPSLQAGTCPVHTGREFRAAWIYPYFLKRDLFKMFGYSDASGFSLLSVFKPLSLKGLYVIAPGSARGIRFPKRKNRCTHRWLREPHGFCSAKFTGLYFFNITFFPVRTG